MVSPETTLRKTNLDDTEVGEKEPHQSKHIRRARLKVAERKRQMDAGDRLPKYREEKNPARFIGEKVTKC